MDRIIAKDYDDDGVPEYLCLWLGYAPCKATWETEQNIISVDAIEEFEEKYADPNIAEDLDKKADEVIAAMVKFQEQQIPKYDSMPRWSDRTRIIINSFKMKILQKYVDDDTIEEAKALCRKIYCNKKDATSSYRVWIKVGEKQFFKAGVQVNGKEKKIKCHGCGFTENPKETPGRWRSVCDKDTLCVHATTAFIWCCPQWKTPELKKTKE